MSPRLLPLLLLSLAAVPLAGAASKKGGPKKVELPHPFYWAQPDPLRGDWEGAGGYVAQVVRADDRLLSVEDLMPSAADVGGYEVHLFRSFDQPNDRPQAILRGRLAAGVVALSGDGWTAKIANGKLTGSKAGETIDLHHVVRTPPTLGAKPPPGARVLFDGSNLDAWARRDAKDWLKTDGPAPWEILQNGAMQIVPNSGYLLTKRSFGAYRLHVEFRNLGGPTNSGVYLETRYEANINEMYGRLDGNACAQFDNCTEQESNPNIRCSRPPLEWQTMDIEFHPPRFDGSGEKTASARATVYFNGVLYYHDQAIGPPKLNAAKLGEEATGPLMLQDHGMPVQFRNLWLVPLD